MCFPAVRKLCSRVRVNSCSGCVMRFVCWATWPAVCPWKLLPCSPDGGGWWHSFPLGWYLIGLSVWLFLFIHFLQSLQQYLHLLLFLSLCFFAHVLPFCSYVFKLKCFLPLSTSVPLPLVFLLLSDFFFFLSSSSSCLSRSSLLPNLRNSGGIDWRSQPLFSSPCTNLLFSERLTHWWSPGGPGCTATNTHTRTHAYTHTHILLHIRNQCQMLMHYHITVEKHTQTMAYMLTITCTVLPHTL